MNYEGTNFKKIYFKDFITTKLHKEEEKKDLSNKVLPDDWNSKDFDYKQPWISNKMTTKGYAVPTGKINNITVLDFDSKEVYNEACNLVPDLGSYYSVITRNGRHVYFLYDESITGKSKIKKVDVQNNGRFVIGPDTLLKRYTGHTFLYAFDGGKLKHMPEALRKWACEVKECGKQPRIHNSNIDYSYEVTDDECRDILDQLAVSHREYFDTYSTWLTFTAIMKTLNKKDLWEEYSERYADGNFNKYKNDVIWKKNNKKIPINTFCKLLKIPSITYHKKVAEDELYNEITYYEETTRLINNKFIEVTQEDFLKNDTIILESGTGTGKTTCVATLLNDLEVFNDGCTVLNIVNLISLANQQKITFEQIYKDLTMYNDKKVNASILMANNACICINSLWKLKNCDFRNKIVYIDEIYSLCISLTDNETLHNQRDIENTLYRIIATCKKLIVSDAHIHNNVMELINHRLFNTEKTYVHYCNEYQKFNGIPAVRFNDENKFFGRLEKKVTAGESFSFACDNKTVVTDWYRKLFAIASLETQSKMYLYTAGEDTVIQKDWKDKIIFYSPKITTGVDITCIKSSEQFIFITGQSVSSISLLQMATRTRNMKRLNYYSCARSFESQYESFEDCRKKITEKYVVSELGFSYDDIESFITETNHFNRVELMHLNLYIRNCYALDLHNTNKLYYFEQELKACGFCIQPSEGVRAKINKAIKVEFNEQSRKIKGEKYDLLIQSFNDSEIILPKGIQPMKERCNLLNLSTAEHVNEYKELIEDSANLDQFFNYNALKKSYDHCEMKVRDTVNRKMIAGIEKNKWFKIKYVHMLAKLCKIEDNLFDIASIQMPKVNKENIKLIENIKTLYNKRDSTEIEEYNLESVTQLYKFMIDNLTKRLNLYSNTKCRVRGDENYDKLVLKCNEDAFNKYEELILIMNRPRVDTVEEEEE